MDGLAYQISSTHTTSEQDVGLFRTFGKRIRARFSRQSKPCYHLGGQSPEERVAVQDFNLPYDENRDLEDWPQIGSTFEDMDVRAA